MLTTHDAAARVLTTGHVCVSELRWGGRFSPLEAHRMRPCLCWWLRTSDVRAGVHRATEACGSGSAPAGA